MEFVLIPTIAFGAALLTFFSGFGLGTLLLPVFLMFFSIQEAILLTASVHLINNVFKGSIVASHIQGATLLTFGIPSILGAWVGAEALTLINSGNPLFQYSIGNTALSVFPTNLAIGILMIVFTLFELIPSLEKLEFDSKWMIPGGILSGFFGGFSGHQGALRSAFLIRTGLTKEAFIATGTCIAIGVDLTRIGKYLTEPGWLLLQEHQLLIGLAILSAATGSLVGKRLLKKITLQYIKKIVAIFMGTIALLTIGGILS